MKKQPSTRPKKGIPIVAAACLILGLLILARLDFKKIYSSMSGQQPSAKQTVVAEVPPEALGVHPAGIPAANALSPSVRVEVTQPVPFAFDALIAGRVPVRKETRMFQAQKWEVDLAKALDLPPGTPLQRRSAVYEVPELKFSHVRVDRVYRMDRNIPKPKAPAELVKEEVGAKKPAAVAEAQETGAAVIDAAGGELLWDNAMILDHLMVQAQKGVSREQLQSALPESCRLLSAIDAAKGLYLVAVPADGDRSVERAVMALNHESLQKVIKFAEPDFLMGGADTTPDDPLFTTNSTDTSKQWHLPKIMAPRAWDVVKQPAAVGGIPATTIANFTVVAVVDTGIDYTHPDLIPNLYVNPGESGGGKETNGIDDDGNGKIDDYRGWNFVDNNNDPMDDVGHGTHVAGIIGAVGNNTNGVTGVCWGVKMLPLRIIKKVGLGTFGTYSDAVAAMSYMRTLNTPTQRIRVANHSWGGGGFSLAMLNALNNPLASAAPLPTGLSSTFARDVNVLSLSGSATEKAKVKIGMTACSTALPENTRVTIIDGSNVTLSNYTTQSGTGAVVDFINPELPKQYGVVHVAAAGNSRFNLDRVPTYPASLPSGFVISVAASDVNDAPAIWAGTAGSNFGKLTTDLFAPGSSIWSTRWKQPGDPSYGYESRNGTSMAAPQVAGAVALLRMWQPKMTDIQARQILIDQVEPIAGLKDKCISGGRLNVARMVDKLYTPTLLASGGSTSGSGTAATPMTGAAGITGLISAGAWVTLAVKEGKVFAWGSNYYRGLGSATLVDSATPVEVPGLDNVMMVATGGHTCYAIKTDGTVWAWGDNTNKLIGVVGTGSLQTTPIQIPDMTDIVWISNGSSHSLAVKADGSVWAWGKNQSGQLGEALTTTQRLTPVQVQGLDHILMAEAGSEHSIALRDDGKVFCWGKRGVVGDTSANALGDGAVSGVTVVPIEVPNLSGVSFVDAGNGTSLALLDDGTVWTWGSHFSPANVPTQRAGLSNIILTMLNQAVGWAMDADGRIYGWGSGNTGQLGNGSYETVADYSEIANAGDQAMVALTGNISTCYVRALDGTVFATGINGGGLLGTGVSSTKYFPVPMPTLSNISNIAFGRTSWPVGFSSTSGYAGFALDTTGHVFRWGESQFGYSATPRETTTMSGATKLKVSPGLCMFTKADGTLWRWGGTTSSVSPVQILVGGSVIDFSGSADSMSSLNGSGGFAAAVLSDGSLKMWGLNTYGQLGDGTIVARSSPTTVTGLTGTSKVIKVATGAVHTLALREDGTVWAWGGNQRGQLGDGTANNSSLPKQIEALSDVIAIAAVAQASFAVKQNGSVMAWGEPGSFPGLGVGNGSNDVTTPTQVPGLPSVTAISASEVNVVALASNQTVWAWGQSVDYLGRGQGSPFNLLPGQVFGLSNVVEVLAGKASYARKADGSLWAWGTLIGDGKDKTNFPVSVLGFAGASQTLSSLGTQDSAASWQFQNFSVPELLNDNIVSDAADPDGDGISNLIEYALGLNPQVRDSSGLPKMRADLIAPKAQSESAYISQISLFDVCPVGSAKADLISGKQYPVYTVERQGGIRQDIDYIIEVSEDLQLWRTGDPYTIKVLDTAETLEAYSATPMEDADFQFMRLKIQRK